MHQSLQHMLNALTALVALLKKLDVKEAKASVEELNLLIQQLKEDLKKKYNKKEFVVKLQQGI